MLLISRLVYQQALSDGPHLRYHWHSLLHRSILAPRVGSLQVALGGGIEGRP